MSRADDIAFALILGFAALVGIATFVYVALTGQI